MALSNGHPVAMYAYEPDYAVPPGQTLQETIDALGIDQRELASRAELSPKHVNQIVKGIAPITHDTAIRLERVTGVPARMWNNLESTYRDQLARQKAREQLTDDLEWLKCIPTGELIRRGAIPDTKNNVDLLEHVLAFFGVATVDAWKEGWSTQQFAFRKSLSFEGELGAMATWLRLGELEANKLQTSPFDKATFRKALEAIRSHTVEAPEVIAPQMISLCADAGVALVLIPEIKGAPVSGAAKWITPSKAMICLNPRGKRTDRFWFSFFHEAGHLLNDSKKETYIDVDYATDGREQRANDFAATTLIPAEYNQELRLLKTHAQVKAFADRIGIAPGIVVEMLHREGVIPSSQLNALKQKLLWSE